MTATLAAAFRALRLPETGRRGLRHCLPLAILFGTAPAHGQVLDFRHLTGLDGIPQSQILAIHQDTRHYLWIGTYGGLSRFNGAEFRTYSTGHGLPANTITSITEDAHGRIVVGAIGGGVCILDEPRFRCLREADGLPHDDVLDVTVTRGGNVIWASTQDGLARIEKDQIRVFREADGIPGTANLRLSPGPGGELWVGGERGLVRWTGRRFEPIQLDGSAGSPVTLLRHTGAGLVVGTPGRLFLSTDRGFRELPTPPVPVATPITDVAAGPDGALWFATRAGVLRYDDTGFERFTADHGLLFDQINRVRVDREGNVWFGTERGLSRLTPGPFRSYTLREGLPNPFVRAIAADRGGRLWLGTRDGIAVREGDSFRPLSLGSEVGDRRVYALAPVPGGGMLIGTGAELVLHDGERVRRVYDAADGMPTGTVFALRADPSGGVWIGTRNGIARWQDGRITRVGGDPLLGDVFVVSLALDGHGRLWAGLRSGGVLVYDGDTVREIGTDDGLTDQTIWAIARDPAGTMWIGSNGYGVFRIPEDDLDSIHQTSSADGLVDDFVWQVQPDRDGSVWLYTNRGIDRIDAEGIRHYGAGRGLHELEGSAGASWLDVSGDLWFGTSVSVVRYTPSRDLPAPHRPPIFIEGAKIGADIIPLTDARFRAGDGVLKVRFASPSFSDAPGVRYRYRLVGTDGGWSDVTAERSIGYAELAPGPYTFEVYAIDSGGATSADVASFSFTVLPRAWQTWWFRLLAALAVLLACGVVVVIRTRALEAERRRLEEMVSRSTRELSRKNAELEREVVERQQVEAALLASRERMEEVLEYSTNMFYTHGLDGVFTYVSPQSRRILGCEPEAALRCFSEFVTSNPVNEVGLSSTSRALETGERQPPYLLELCGRDRVKRWVEVNEAPVMRDGRVIGIVGSLTDVTDAKLAAAEQDRLEAQLRQAQKMEAVGRLAGGIAHDFNNLLTAVVGNTELIEGALEAAHPLHLEVGQIRAAADRATALVSQLLAFSRQQLIRRDVLDLNVVVGDSARMLRRMIGADVELRLDLATDELWIEADRSQLDQVLINLAVNARDAMPSGGSLVVSTRAVEIGSSQIPGLDGDLPPGRYVALRVSDNGQGMDADTVSHVFEPFFTTKEVGKGTGLGLATVYGIVTQNGGGVRIDSAPGKGTTFHILLPRASSPRPAPHGKPTPAKSAPDHGPVEAKVVLVVEDEDAVRLLVRRTLERFGYRVLQAENGAAAIELCEGHPEQIDLLLTDMVMPGINGREVAERIGEIRPGIRILYMSGHTRDVLGSRFMLDGRLRVVQKPFSPAELVQHVRAELESPELGAGVREPPAVTA